MLLHFIFNQSEQLRIEWYTYNWHMHTSILVINSNLPPILHRFQVMAAYISNFL